MPSRFAKTMAGLGLAVLLGGLAPAGARQPQRTPGEPEKGRSGAAMDPTTGKRLNEAIEHLNAQRYAEARAVLERLNLDRLSPYERSRAEQLFAAVDLRQGHYGPAREHLKKAIASEGLNDQETSQVNFQIAQLFMAEDKWREGAEALRQWFATAEKPNSAAYYLLAVAHYQLGSHEAALEPAQKAIELAGGTPQESWLQLLLALRLEREEYRNAIPVLKQLLEVAPAKKTYWLQLAAANAQAGSPDDAGVALQLAYYAGLLTEAQDVQRLTGMLLQNAIPYRAAKILGQALDQGLIKADVKSEEQLANCWVAAREYEKAIQPLRRAADLSDSGELYGRLAEIYVQREDWGNATEVLRLAFAKGKLKKPGNAQILMGLSLYKQKKVRDARSWFERAREQADSREQADAWLKHIEEESRSSDKTVEGTS
jgi:Flp pilus assembly protein TadD